MTTTENIRTPHAKQAAPRPWRLRQRLGIATLVTSNLLFPAASNVLVPRPPNCGSATILSGDNDSDREAIDWGNETKRARALSADVGLVLQKAEEGKSL